MLDLNELNEPGSSVKPKVVSICLCPSLSRPHKGVRTFPDGENVVSEKLIRKRENPEISNG
jgi:hypothetical protein